MEGKLILRSGIGGATVRQASVHGIEFHAERRLRDRNPFLVNGHKITGTFYEECSPGKAIGRENKEGQLKIQKGTILNVLLTNIVVISPTNQFRRIYKWAFTVLEVIECDLPLFPSERPTEVDEDNLIFDELPEGAWGLPREIALQLFWMPHDKVGEAVDYLLGIDLDD